MNNFGKNCTCPCGCQEPIDALNPFGQCEECTHGDCGVTGFETEQDLIEGGKGE